MVPMEMILRLTPQRVLPPVGIVEQRQWGLVALVVLAVAVAVALVGILVAAAMVAPQTHLVGLVVLLEAAALAAAVVATSKSTTLQIPVKQKFLVVAVVAELASLALALTGLAGALLAVAVAVGLVVLVEATLLAELGQTAATTVVVVVRRTMSLTSTLGLSFPQVLEATALSALSASSGVMVAPIRRTPQTSN